MMARRYQALWAVLLCWAAGSAASADEALGLVPERAFIVLRVEQLRLIYDRAAGHFQRLGLERFDEVQEFLQSTPALQLKQFLAYLEKTYSRPWPKLVDDLTAGGVTLALVAGKDQQDTRVLGIVRGRDAKLLATVYATALAVMKSEAGQAEKPVKVESSKHGEVEITSFGKDFHLARQGESLLFANKLDTLQGALDRATGKAGKSLLDHPRFAVKERPASAGTLAWGWVDLVPLKKQGGEELERLRLPTNEIFPHLLFGGLIDAYLRSDRAWFAITDDERGPALVITTPAGREQSQQGNRQLHMHDPGAPGILPLLRPAGTVYSTSFYWDLSALYNQRKDLYKADALKDFENGEKQVRPFLAGNTLGQLFNHLGARHRIVVARQREQPYKIKPKTPYPTFAFVAECRDAEKFFKAVSVPLRGAGFFLSTQVSMKLTEETYGGCKIVGYRFNEVDKNRQYQQGDLFNYTPCFAQVGKFVIFSSSMELCRDLIDELQKTPSAAKDETDIRHEFSWSALGEALAAERAFVATELTLRHGGAIGRVDEQIGNVLQLLDRLGTLEATVSHSPQFRLELRAKFKGN